jgi:hypothetical protein
MCLCEYMKTFRLVKGDTLPRLSFTITKDGVPLSLNGASILFKFRKLAGSVTLFSRPCTIINAAAGTCYYDWQTGDLANVGAHIGEIEVTFSNGFIQTCKDLLKFEVRDEL